MVGMETTAETPKTSLLEGLGNTGCGMSVAHAGRTTIESDILPAGNAIKHIQIAWLENTG